MSFAASLKLCIILRLKADHLHLHKPDWWPFLFRLCHSNHATDLQIYHPVSETPRQDPSLGEISEEFFPPTPLPLIGFDRNLSAWDCNLLISMVICHSDPHLMQNVLAILIWCEILELHISQLYVFCLRMKAPSTFSFVSVDEFGCLVFLARWPISRDVTWVFWGRGNCTGVPDLLGNTPQSTSIISN